MWGSRTVPEFLGAMSQPLGHFELFLLQHVHKCIMHAMLGADIQILVQMFYVTWKLVRLAFQMQCKMHAHYKMETYQMRRHDVGVDGI